MNRSKASEVSPASDRRKNSARRKICSVVALSFLAMFFVFFLFRSVDRYKFAPADLKFDSRNVTDGCEKVEKPRGCRFLPKGIITQVSDLEMKPLFEPLETEGLKSQKNLLAIAVGIKQKKNVDQIVTKFFSCGFHVMIFHYDGSVDAWRAFPWYDQAIHVSAKSQTKWWFAKRFLHPDIVSDYTFIFLWDEDLGVEHFNPLRYLDIVVTEGLEVSQPALDTQNGSKVHHQITVHQQRRTIHRRVINKRCNKSSLGPPCVGWVEMMAPAFSRAAWRCTWHMIQNDLIHAWGLDYKLGYCVQGDRTKKIGVVDAEYVIHKNILSLAGIDSNKGHSELSSSRSNVRTRSSREMREFDRRWKMAVEEDKCWSDPFSHS